MPALPLGGSCRSPLTSGCIIPNGNALADSRLSLECWEELGSCSLALTRVGHERG